MKNLFSLFLISILLTGCGIFSPNTESLTVVPTQTPLIISFLTPTPTFTRPPENTTTATRTPMPIATLPPTVTPIGMVTGADDAVFLIPPAGWDVIENNAEKISLVNNLAMLDVQIYAYPTNGKAMDDDLRFNFIMGPLSASFEADKTLTVTRQQVEKIAFNDGLTGKVQPFLLERESGDVIKVEVTVLGNNFYNLVIIASGSPLVMEQARSTLDQLVKSVHLRGSPGTTSAETNPGTIRVAVHAALSGSMSQAGLDIKRGAELAMEQKKSSLAKLGYKLELVEYDDQGSQEVGVKNAKRMVKDTAVMCVIGHYTSAIQVTASEVYHAAGLANISPANTDPKVTDRGYNEVSRIVGRDDNQGTAAALFAAKKGIQSVFVLNDTTGYGENLAQFFTHEAQRNGIRVVGYEGTEEKEDFTTLLELVLGAKPDAIYFSGMYDQVAMFIKQARQRGYTGMFLSGDNFNAPEAAKIAGEVLSQGGGVFFTTVAGLADWFPGANRFVRDFNDRYGYDPVPFAAQGYDAMGLCLQAIELAMRANNNKMPARAEVTNAVRTISGYPGITGTIRFNPNGDLIESSYFVIQVASPNSAEWWENKPVDTILVKIE